MDESYFKMTATENDFGQDVHEMERYLRGQIVYGEELWLDLLVSAVDKNSPGRGCGVLLGWGGVIFFIEIKIETKKTTSSSS